MLCSLVPVTVNSEESIARRGDWQYELFFLLSGTAFIEGTDGRKSAKFRKESAKGSSHDLGSEASSDGVSSNGKTTPRIEIPNKAGGQGVTENQGGLSRHPTDQVEILAVLRVRESHARLAARVPFFLPVSHFLVPFLVFVWFTRNRTAPSFLRKSFKVVMSNRLWLVPCVTSSFSTATHCWASSRTTLTMHSKLRKLRGGGE
jgi:hypothetical protein